MYVLMFAATFVWKYFSETKLARYDVKCIYWSSYDVPVFLVRFYARFSKNTEMSNLMKSRSVLAELFHADGRTDWRTDSQTDMTKLVIAFRNFANAPINFIAKNGRSFCTTFSILSLRLRAITKHFTRYSENSQSRHWNFAAFHHWFLEIISFYRIIRHL